MSCIITSGIDSTCETARLVGGLNQRVWLVSSMSNSSDGSVFSYTLASGVITDLAFAYQGGLVPFTGVKNSHSAGVEQVPTGDGGNYINNHNVILKVSPSTAEERETLDDLAGWTGAIVVEDRNKRFFVYGYGNGMRLISKAQNFGAVGNTDITYVLTFQGEESGDALQFLDTDYATSLATLLGYEL